MVGERLRRQLKIRRALGEPEGPTLWRKWTTVEAQSLSTRPLRGLSDFVRAVNERLRGMVEDSRFPPDQRLLLRETVARFERHTDPNSHAQPLGLTYLVLQAWGGRLDQRAVHLGAFCMAYLCSGDLFDDVQDDDLAGKPHADTGSAIAVNSALALMFLAFDELRYVLQLEPDAALHARYLEAFNRVSLIGVGCQHADLLGARAVTSPADVLERDRGKTSSVALFLECGALLAGCSAATLTTYREVGGELAQMTQIVDDVRDVYGKSFSPDVATDKISFPVACLLEDGSLEQIGRFRALQRRHPESLSEIRELLYEVGAVERCALELERLRRSIHRRIASTGNACAAHRALLSVVDTLSGSLYAIDPIAETAPWWQPQGGFHDEVRAALQAFSSRMQPFGAPAAPRLEPWSWPHYLYDPERGTLYYPDVDGLPGDVLPFYAGVFGVEDPSIAAELLREQLPLTIAHEMFHRWRDRAGRLTSDHWHEEYVANSLAVGYASRYYPELLARIVGLARRVVARADSQLSVRARAILERCSHEHPEARGYELDVESSAAVHFWMLERLIAVSDFASDLTRWLSPQGTACSGSLPHPSDEARP